MLAQGLTLIALGWERAMQERSAILSEGWGFEPHDNHSNLPTSSETGKQEIEFNHMANNSINHTYGMKSL